VALDARQLRKLVIRPALLEIELWSEAAEELVLGTAIVESRLSFIKQLGSGPALGLWQIEPDTHRDVYENFLEYREASTIRSWGYQHRARRSRRTSHPICSMARPYAGSATTERLRHCLMGVI